MRGAVIRVVCLHPPDTSVEVADVRPVIRSGNKPEYGMWPTRRDGSGLGSAICRHRDQGAMWDLRCAHAAHTAPGGLTAQLSLKTVTRLVEECAAGGAEPPYIVLLPLLVDMLRRRLLGS
jgi:hypothetical protein